jgi:hypothetical protein
MKSLFWEVLMYIGFGGTVLTIVGMFLHDLKKEVNKK